MMTKFIKALALQLAFITCVPLFAACAPASVENGKDDEPSGEVTTDPTSEEPVITRDIESLLAANVYAADGLEYALYTIETYYQKRNHTIKRSLTNANACEIWYAGAFLEMLAEAYKLYPDNSTIKSTYVDMLDECLPKYLVANSAIKTPAKTYRKMSYYNAGVNSSGDFYYDDNAWICYELLEAYELLGDEKYLTLAENNLEFLWTGWRENGGGIYWSKDFGNVGTCSTSPTGVCFLRAYMLTGKEDYLEKGQTIYDWLISNVYGSNGLVYAGIGDNWQPSYDNGTVIMNACLLYQITGTKKYYNLARSLSNAVINHAFNVSTSRNGSTTASLKTNPYYCPWAFTWLLRGVAEFYKIDNKKIETFYDSIKYILDKRKDKKNENGQYDPYLGTGCKDWLGDGRTFSNDHVVIMPAGYAEMLLVVGYFDVYLSESAVAGT